jgi:hypothetical protein
MFRNLLKAALMAAFPFFSQAQEYFQQEVHYRINVELNDSNNSLNAFMELDYINHSPDTLNFIYMHLWPNAYKNNSTALANQLLEMGQTNFYYAEDKDRGYIDQLDFNVNGEKVKWEYDPEHIDICKVYLNEPLLPGQKLLLSSPFFVKIPKGVYSRLGHIGESFQISQWYPKPAVYDKHGWHQMPYLSQGEFFSEFGSFDVSITLPANYVVGSTGDLIDGEQELAWLNAKAMKTEKIKEFPSDMSFPPSDTKKKTLRYFQKDVHDFAWFADKRFHVLKGEVELPQSKRKVTLWAMFTNAEAPLWMRSIEYLHDAVYYYSLWNGEYPYNHVTAVDGSISAGGGMEYPNVTVIGTSRTAFLLETVIVHEVGHNWFYGILGTNERVHPWMDEGINSFNELRYMRMKYPKAGLLGLSKDHKVTKILNLEEFNHKSQYELAYLLNARRNLDQPIELPAPAYTSLNYGAIVYSKTAIVFDYLREYLGSELFDQCMHEYFNQWKFKHPYPNDLRKIFEEVSGKNLSWFFDDVINTSGKFNYKLKSAKKSSCETSPTGKCYNVNIRNKGDIASPFSVSLLKNDSVFSTQWFEGFYGKSTFCIPNQDADEVRIDAGQYIPEINRRNSIQRMTGFRILPNPMKVQFIGSVEAPYHKQVYYFPVIGWNNYNKTMLGVALYNNVIPQPKAQYVLMPMYSFGTKREAGMGTIAYNWFPDASPFQNIRLSLHGSRFAYSNQNNYDLYFSKIDPRLNFELKKKDPRSPINQNIQLRSVNIYEDISRPVFNDDLSFSHYGKQQHNYFVNEIQYNLFNTRAINSYNLRAMAQQGQGFAKIQAEFNYRFNYSDQQKGADIRIFAGKFIHHDSPDPRFLFAMSGNRDYTYDYVFLGRTETKGFLGRQFAMNDGGFKNITTLSPAGNWLSSINIKVPIPGPAPLAFYADGGLASVQFGENLVFGSWNTGIAVMIVRDVFEIYFPVAMSSNLNLLSYDQKIRFILNLHKLNPFDFIRNIAI